MRLIGVLLLLLVPVIAEAQFTAYPPPPPPPQECTVCPCEPPAEWPLHVVGYDFVPGVVVDVFATVPRQDGRHDKVVYSSQIKAAALFTRDFDGARCYQVATNFHPEMTFTGVTVDSTRTFSWHDRTGWWSFDWPEQICIRY